MTGGLHAYHVSRKIEAEQYPFYALIFAAMRQADTDNLELLKTAWPDVWEELVRRYNAPLGVLPEDGILPEAMDELAQGINQLLAGKGWFMNGVRLHKSYILPGLAID